MASPVFVDCPRRLGFRIERPSDSESGLPRLRARGCAPVWARVAVRPCLRPNSALGGFSAPLRWGLAPVAPACQGYVRQPSGEQFSDLLRHQRLQASAVSIFAVLRLGEQTQEFLRHRNSVRDFHFHLHYPCRHGQDLDLPALGGSGSRVRACGACVRCVAPPSILTANRYGGGKESEGLCLRAFASQKRDSSVDKRGGYASQSCPKSHSVSSISLARSNSRSHSTQTLSSR